MGRREEGTYLAGAIGVRLVTEGAGVGLTLAAAIGLHSVGVGGALLAVFTAPSVVAAPLIGAALDSVRSPRRFMLGASVVLGASLAVAAFLADLPIAAVVLALVAGGCVLPVFVGGLSAFVAEAMPGEAARGFTVDALSYNLAGIGGPALVADVSALLSPRGALLVLAGVALLGGLLLQLLPIRGRGGSAHPAAIARGVAAAARHMVRHGPLARVVAAGAVVQIAGGAGPVVAVLVAAARGAGQQAGGVLLTAFAVGGVVGAFAITVPAISRRLARLPGRATMAVCFGACGVLLGAAAFTPSFAATLVLFALAGLPDAPGIAAMLRLRQEESPVAVRGQVFVVAAGSRVATAAVGSALAGAASGLPAALLLGLMAVPWLAAVPILAPWSRSTPTAARDTPTVAR